jgi:hypothetical protein
MPLSTDPVVRAKQTANLTPAPPAPPGNARALKHGLDSGRFTRLVDEHAPTLAMTVFEQNPHLDPARDGASVLRYVRTFARVEYAHAWLDDQPDPLFVDPEQGKVHPLIERVEHWEAALDKRERQLAIAPLTRAQLGLTIAQGRSLVERMADDYEREANDAA